MAEPRSVWESLNVAGDQAVDTLKRLLREGNVRRIRIKSKQGRTLLDLPVNAGVLGFVLAPAWVTVGAVAALVGGLTIDVERTQTPAGPDAPTPGSDVL
jgi:Domain of unknown function (DUF4342)